MLRSEGRDADNEGGWANMESGDKWEISVSSCQLPYFAIYNVHPHFLAQTFRKTILCFVFFNYLFIFRYLFLYYKGILAFIFEHTMVQEILWNR